MKHTNQFRSRRHCVFKLHAHLVFIPKYRKNIFTKQILLFLENTFQNICDGFDTKLIEFNGESDHVHLLIEYPPKHPISKIVNCLKEASYRLLKQKFPILKKYYWKNALWSPSYCVVSCGGAPLQIIKQYIQKQRLISPP